MRLNKYLNPTVVRKLLSLFGWGLIFIGISFRLILFFQNRNLIIDEANIVRNIYERDFIGLLKPLSYQQYAPPLFLWMEELWSLLLGYSEQAMRLTALICGIGALFVYRKLLRKILPLYSSLLPLGLFCFAPIVAKYATEVKQYIPDAFVAISLVYTALVLPQFSTTRFRFVAQWILVGSIAIWAAQPSVFVLASVGLYYFVQCLMDKKWTYIPALLLIGAIWLSQFFIYYWFILRQQINSDYLQSYHQNYFLFLLPQSSSEWQHNGLRMVEIINNSVGYYLVPFYLGTILILVGFFSLLRKSMSLFLLLVAPIALTLFAAALHQFSLIERVCIFILPFMMILAGFGLDYFIQLGNKVVTIGATLAALLILSLHNFGSLFYRQYQFQELTRGLDYLLQQKASGTALYVDCASRDTYIYYTQIHPHKDKYAPLKAAYLFDWVQDDFATVSRKIKGPNAYFIFTGGHPDARYRHLKQMEVSLNMIDSFTYKYCYVYRFATIQVPQ
jgi:hypothetical protein